MIISEHSIILGEKSFWLIIMFNGFTIILLIDLKTKVDISSFPNLVLLFKLVIILSTTVSVTGFKFRFTSSTFLYNIQG